MGKKQKSTKQTWLRTHAVPVGLGIFLVALWGTVAYQAIHTKPKPKPSQTAQGVPIYFKRAEDAMPLPATVDPAKFKSGSVRAAYQVAREIPEVLAQRPCYCYCQRIGHRGLLDCFQTEHAATCNICIKEALLAGQMHREGKSAEQIRAAIIQGQWAKVASSTEPVSSETDKSQ
jgi:hypothetical protein